MFLSILFPYFPIFRPKVYSALRKHPLTADFVLNHISYRAVNTLRLSYKTHYFTPYREIGLEVSADKIKYMVMSRDQNAGQIHSVRMKVPSRGWKSLNIWEQLNKSKFYCGKN